MDYKEGHILRDLDTMIILFLFNRLNARQNKGLLRQRKKTYIDLMFTNENDVFIEWLENLETTLQKLIFEKRNLWFHNDLEMSDIEHAFTSPVRSYKGGKFYLVRANVAQSRHFQEQNTCSVYNEDENVLTQDAVTTEKKVISVIEVQGVKFSSRTFQIEIVIKQVMIIDEKPIFQTCVIKRYNALENNKISENLDKLEVENTLEESAVPIEDKEDQEGDDIVHIDKPIIDASLEIPIDNLENIDEKQEPLEVKEEQEVETERKEELKEEVHLNEEVHLKEEDTLENKTDIPTENKTADDKNDLDNLTEINVELDENLESMTLKKPNEVYYEIYRAAREKAKLAKKAAVQAYLEAKNIKATYMLDDIDDSENEEEMDDLMNNLE